MRRALQHSFSSETLEVYNEDEITQSAIRQSLNGGRPHDLKSIGHFSHVIRKEVDYKIETWQFNDSRVENVEEGSGLHMG